jgi:chromosome segregation ATPase
MCLSHTDQNGKSKVASDRSIESLEARISNLSASEAVCQARRKQLEEQVFQLKTANEELRKMRQRDRRRMGDEEKDDVL